MISSLSPSGLQFLNSVNSLQTRLNKIQNELSSGLAVSQASDAPDQVSAILQLHVDIQHNDQVQQNLTAAQGNVQTADQNLSSGLTILDQVSTLAAEGLGVNQNASTRSTLAGQVDDLLKQMLSISQTKVSGRYLFGGDADQSPSYQYNPNSPIGVDRLQVSTSTTRIEDASGGTFAVGLSANQIFDARDSQGQPANGNVFASINAVRVALLNNDVTALQTAQAGIQGSSTYLNQQQGFYGAVENRISSALTQAATSKTDLQTDLSHRQDADATAAILQMQQYTTEMQAAISSEAKMPQTNLFNLIQG